MKEKVLSKIGEKINEENILWGVGASVLLHYNNIVEYPNDIDIIVTEEDTEKLHKILCELGTYMPLPYKKPFHTKYFHHYIVDGTEIDVMGGFAIEHESGIYTMPFDNSSIVEQINIGGISISFTSLEDWYVLYMLIPGRDKKVKMIEDYLIQNGMKNPSLLKRTLKEPLPEYIKLKVNNLLNIKSVYNK